MVNSIGGVFFAVHAVLGLYLLNLFFKIIAIPATFAQFEKFVFVASGGLLILAGVFWFFKFGSEKKKN